jgi:hypothetical protein
MMTLTLRRLEPKFVFGVVGSDVVNVIEIVTRFFKYILQPCYFLNIPQ